MTTLSERIEHDLEEIGIHVAVEIDQQTVVLSGLIQSEEERESVAEVLAEVAPDYDVEDNLELDTMLPARIEGHELSEADLGGFVGATQLTEDDEALEPGDFTDQQVLDDPFTAGGPSGTAVDEEIGEGEEVYVPPTDPVSDGRDEVIGGFSTSSMDVMPVERLALDGHAGDEALADAIRRELREDAATSDLDVQVDVRNGIVRLTGTVRDLDDVENAEEVASRLPEVLEVREELRVEGM
jgi:osmotically-inducible protein OsmY